VIVLEVAFLAIFWSWVALSVLFLRDTMLPRAALGGVASSEVPPHEPVMFQASDGLRLSGWKMGADPTQPWIILCHGLGTNRQDLLGTAKALHEAGFNLLLFDFRGHGQSEGRTTSMGWREQRDLEGALAYLGSQVDVGTQPYGVFGLSMGGAVAIMVAARDERLGAVAVDSVYADLDAAIGNHLWYRYRLPRIPFVLFVSFTYRLRFGIWPRHVSPIRVARQLGPRPFFVIHGEDDPRMPLRDAKALYHAAQEPKQLWTVPGAVHLAGLETDPKAYRERVVKFFTESLVRG